MGSAPSTPRKSAPERDAAEYLIATFVGEKAFPLASEFWRKLLEVPVAIRWPRSRVVEACEVLAQNNSQTRHMAKILVHLVLSLQGIMSTPAGSSAAYMKAINAAYMSSTFLKYLIENSKTNTFQELYLNIHEEETIKDLLPKDDKLENFIMRGILTFIGSTDVSSKSCFLHHELLNFMFAAMSTQLCSGPSPGVSDVHPFIDAAMLQESILVCSVVRRLLLNYITRPCLPVSSSGYPVFPDDNQPGVLQRFGSAAANFVLLPYYTFNYLVSSSGEGSKSTLADNSLLVLLVLIHYRKCIFTVDLLTNGVAENGGLDFYLDENTQFSDNPYSKALENARDIEFDRLDVEGNAQNGPLVRLPYASLFDTLGLCLYEESSVLLLYSLVHGNSDFLEYVLVRTDLDTLLMPILETLYNTSRRTPNQIYMLLIILLILSQDSSFNASIHKLVLPSVSWYQERLLNNTSLGSLVVIILIRTIKYNLSKLKDMYLHTNCLAILANMAPHTHRLSSYASQRLISLFYMLSRKYTKIAELRNDKKHDDEAVHTDGVDVPEESTELHIYTDFLRIVLEIINAILTYALPRNPEVVYAIMHRQELFKPFKNHPRFNELLENIYTVLDFFNSRMETQQFDGELSVDKVLQVIVTNCRSWRSEGMKMFTQLKFTYEQESHPEEFFIPYVWQLVLSQSGFTFNGEAINLVPVELQVVNQDTLSGEVNV